MNRGQELSTLAKFIKAQYPQVNLHIGLFGVFEMCCDRLVAILDEVVGHERIAFMESRSTQSMKSYCLVTTIE